MDPDYARYYRELHERHWWFRCRRRWIVGELERHLGGRFEGRIGEKGVGPILDVGSGDGLFLPTLEAYGEPEGLEPEAEAVSETTRERWTMHLRPFDEEFRPGRTYGLVTLLDVLEHLDDDIAALRHVRALLRPGGLLLLTVPALRWLWTRHDDLNHHRRRYTRRELVAALEAAGFQVLDSRYLFHWLVPVKLAIRCAERLHPAEPAVPRIPPASLDRFFYLLTRLEQETLSRLRFPLGSSIFAAARPKR